MTRVDVGAGLEHSLWYKDAILYQLHVKAFADSNNDGIGDFAGLTEHLDYLHDLGVTVLWLTPILDNPNDAADDYHGYAAVDEYNTDEHFGAIFDMRALVTAAIAQGMRVYYDFVPNHVSAKHVWLQHLPQAEHDALRSSFLDQSAPAPLPWNRYPRISSSPN